MSIEAGSHSGFTGDVYDAYPNGVGEMPSLEVPGTRRILVPGLKTHRGFLGVIRKGGAIRRLINELHDEGKHVGAKWSANEVTLFVAKHRTALFATAAALGTITAGAIYLTRRSPRNREK